MNILTMLFLISYCIMLSMVFLKCDCSIFYLTVSVPSVWANHGDDISIQYSGTPALKGDFVRYLSFSINSLSVGCMHLYSCLGRTSG